MTFIPGSNADSSSTSAAPRFDSKVAAVVLAAGQGSRFRESSDQTHKLLVEFRGRPLGSWAMSAAHNANFDRLYVVQGAVEIGDLVAEATDGEGQVLDNEAWEQGQATSLAIAIDRAAKDGCSAVVVGLADQPLVPTEAWVRVGGAQSIIAVATFDGDRRPPVRLDRSIWPDLPRHGDAGARMLFRLRPELVSEVACKGNPVDIDTAEDLELWN